jgi:hypothetical protein
MPLDTTLMHNVLNTWYKNWINVKYFSYSFIISNTWHAYQYYKCYSNKFLYNTCWKNGGRTIGGPSIVHFLNWSWIEFGQVMGSSILSGSLLHWLSADCPQSSVSHSNTTPLHQCSNIHKIQCRLYAAYMNLIKIGQQACSTLYSPWLIYVPLALTQQNSTLCPKNVSVGFVWFSQ